MKKSVVELFAGVGGFRVGLNHIREFDETGRAIENGDWEFVWANQWEPSTKTQHAFECYCARFGIENNSNKNISLVNKTDIPNHALLVGGFPCQDYSVARSLSGEKGINGKKGVLFWDIADILKEKKPPFVLLENVDRLLKSPSIQRGRDFGIMLRTFDDLGYNAEWRVINASDYGFAQRRRRVYIYAWKKTTNYNNTIKIYNSDELIFKEGVFAKRFSIEVESKTIHKVKKICISQKKFNDTVQMTKEFYFLFENCGVMLNGDVYTTKVIPKRKPWTSLRQIVDDKNDLSLFCLNQKQEEKFKELRGAKRKLRTKPDGTEYYYAEGAMSEYDSLDLPGRTMLTSEASINRSTHILLDEHLKKLRFITPIEAERMQGFPDDWTNCGMPQKRRYFMMGNALVTNIISELEPLLSDIVESE